MRWRTLGSEWVKEKHQAECCLVREATAGFEPAIGVLQTPALPLGYVAATMGLRWNGRYSSLRSNPCQNEHNEMTGDQTIKCTVCKTPFVWTAAEQAGPKPDRCPMCRRIAPGAGRLRGLVKWYSRAKGYGFITTVQGADVFFHKSGLGEGQAPCAGQLVEFALTHGERGVQAEGVEILAAEGAGANPC